VNIAASRGGIGRLRSHLNAFYIKPVLLEDVPLLRGEKSQVSDRNTGIGNSDLCSSVLRESLWSQNRPKKTPQEQGRQ
jgi:hypothetical protein